MIRDKRTQYVPLALQTVEVFIASIVIIGFLMVYLLGDSSSSISTLRKRQINFFK